MKHVITAPKKFKQQLARSFSSITHNHSIIHSFDSMQLQQFFLLLALASGALADFLVFFEYMPDYTVGYRFLNASDCRDVPLPRSVMS